MYKILSAFALLLISFCAKSQELPYFGADIHTCKTCFKKEHGSEIFKDRSIGGNIFLGAHINKNLSIEMGYQKLKASKHSIVGTSGMVGGIVIPGAIHSIVYRTRVTMKGPFLGFMLFTEKEKFNGLQPFFGFGLMDLNTRIRRETVQVNNISYPFMREMSGSKIATRTIAGFNYFLNDSVAMRSSIIYIGTGKLKTSSKDDLRLIKSNIKNNLCFGVGLTSKIN